MKRFVVIWAGQLVSLLGSGATSFALAVWLLQHTGDIGDLARLAIAAYLPQVLVAPYGGVLADRHDRRRLMLAADAGAALATVAVLLLAWQGHLGPWTATLVVAIGSSCNALQWPAWESAIVALVPRAELGRASGLCELSRGTSQLAAPALAGALFATLGLRGILALDLASFVVGVVALALVRIPPHEPGRRAPDRSVRGRLADLGAAFGFVARRPGLVAMLILFAITNFTFAVVELLLKPLVLSFAAPWALGVVLSTVGVGMVAGSLAMAAWGGPRRKVLAILVFQLVEGSALVLGGARPSLPPMVVAAFFYGLVIPLTFGCARTLWQEEVPAELQGRVAALRNAVVMLAIPVGYAVAAPLAALTERGLGAGVGRATGLVVVAMGALTWAAALGVQAFRPYRRLDAARYDPLEPVSRA